MRAQPDARTRIVAIKSRQMVCLARVQRVVAYGLSVALSAMLVQPGNAQPARDALIGSKPAAQVRQFVTGYPPQMVPVVGSGWVLSPLVTIGEPLFGYSPPGRLDGIAAFALGSQVVRVLANHELRDWQGYPYALANGTVLTGARISFFDIDATTRQVVNAGLAYDTIRARNGQIVTDGVGGVALDTPGLGRLCSAQGVLAGELGFVDDIMFSGEEVHGGTEFALEIATRTMWALPALGRAAFENVAIVQPPSSDTVAILITDDRSSAPLWMYIGEKATGNFRRGRTGRLSKHFLDRNGLSRGTLYAWVADDPSVRNPDDFNGTGVAEPGTFVPVDYYRPELAGQSGYDKLGYATQGKQDTLALSTLGAVRFAKNEDIDTNPANPLQLAMATTGHASNWPSDAWGNLFLIDLSYDDSGAELVPRATLTIAYDGDDAGAGAYAHPDLGLRNPDGVLWSGNGRVYVQEDATHPDFGDVSGEEGSIWEFDPATSVLARIAVMDRSAVAPDGSTDSSPLFVGAWESSGLLDVTDLFDTAPGERLLIGHVMAHTISDGPIGGNGSLVGGGQLLFYSKLTASRPGIHVRR